MSATTHAYDLTRLAAHAAASKKGSELVAFDVSQQIAITDVFLIVTCTNERQVGAVVDSIEEQLLSHGIKALRREGGRENRWVLLDYNDVVVHVQHEEERRLYALERLWRDCPRLDLSGIEAPIDEDTSEGSTPGLLEGERAGA